MNKKNMTIEKLAEMSQQEFFNHCALEAHRLGFAA
jgi:hypothetical protein